MVGRRTRPLVTLVGFADVGQERVDGVVLERQDVLDQIQLLLVHQLVDPSRHERIRGINPARLIVVTRREGPFRSHDVDSQGRTLCRVIVISPIARIAEWG